MKINDRLEKSLASGSLYRELAQMFEAAITEDLVKINDYKNHDSPGVRFAALCNPILEITSADLEFNPLTKYAAPFNKSTSTEILDFIGLNQTGINPVISENVYKHKNVSKEFQVFFALAKLDENKNSYEEKRRCTFPRPFSMKTITAEKLWI
mgnify:CR=1 FL=1